MKMRNYLKSIIVVCVLPMLFFTASVAYAAPLSCGNWKVVTSPNPGVPDNLSAVAAVSATDVWAVGTSGLQSQSGQTVIEHWNGTQWSVVTSPSPGTEYNTLTSVAGVSTSNVWAVGWQSSLGVAETLIEHWNGTQWSVVTSPSPATGGNELFSVTAVSATDLWAVGFMLNNTATGSVEQTLIEHWNGTQWSVVKSPNPSLQTSGLTGVSAATANDVWAVGFAVNSSGIWQTLTEQWNGTHWNVVPSPDPGSQINYLSSVATVSTTGVWAVGYADNQTLTEHWNGTQWSVVTSSGPGSVSNSLVAVTVVSANNVWGVGYYQGSDYVSHTLTEHWNGTQWSVVQSPSPGTINTQLSGVAASSATDIWAVGHADSQTLTEHYC